jgi:hypothetical protein
MPKFQPKEAHESEPAPLTPNRAALRDLNAARAASQATIAELRERLNRLDALKTAIGPIEAELAALDASEAAALANWSANPDAPAPTPDIEARQSVMARLSAAKQQIAGAEQATVSVSHVLEGANTRAVSLEHQVPAAIAAVMLDEARLILPGIVEATLALAKVQSRYASLRKFLLERAEAAKDVASRSGFFHDLERLDREATDAARIAPLLTFNAGNEWRELADSLGDVPHRPAPTMPAAFPGMPAMDPWRNDQ